MKSLMDSLVRVDVISIQKAAIAKMLKLDSELESCRREQAKIEKQWESARRELHVKRVNSKVNRFFRWLFRLKLPTLTSISTQDAYGKLYLVEVPGYDIHAGYGLGIEEVKKEKERAKILFDMSFKAQEDNGYMLLSSNDFSFLGLKDV